MSPAPRLVRDATFLEADRREIALRRGPHNRLGFAYQVAFVRVLDRFQVPLEIDGEIDLAASERLDWRNRMAETTERAERAADFADRRARDADRVSPMDDAARPGRGRHARGGRRGRWRRCRGDLRAARLGTPGRRIRTGVETAPDQGPGKIALEIFERLCEPALVRPTFVHDFPTEVSPLSK